MLSIEEITNYLSSYQQYNKLLRIKFLFSILSDDYHEYLRTLLIQELLSSKYTQFYKDLLAKQHIIQLGHENELLPWMQTMDKQLTAQLTMLEHDHIAAKSVAIKETIRLGYIEIGHCYLSWGRLEDALLAYLKSRDYCTMPKHHIDCSFAIISIYLNYKQYYNALTFASRLSEFIGNDLQTLGKINAILGFIALCEKNYTLAYKKFLEIDTIVLTDADVMGLFTIQDLGKYICLVALLTQDRYELHKLLTTKKQWIMTYMIDPISKGLFVKIAQGNYQDCLSILYEIQEYCKLDMHVSIQLTDIITTISEKLIVQYFTPFSIVNLHKMATSFAIDMMLLEDKLIDLIARQVISAKIDSLQGIMIRIEPKLETYLVTKATNMTNIHVETFKRSMLRLSLYHQKIFDGSSTSSGSMGVQAMVGGRSCGGLMSDSYGNMQSMLVQQPQTPGSQMMANEMSEEEGEDHPEEDNEDYPSMEF